MSVRRLFTKEDLARVSCTDCSGCGDCCRGMGDTVELDPYDAFMLSAGLGKPFEQLLGQCVGLKPASGIVIPYLKMTGEENPSCVFLKEDGRCGIHPFRPGICRLFPLGRQYDGDKIRYFILEGGCDRPQSKVRIDRYIGIPDMDDYERYKAEWHAFVKMAGGRLGESGDDEFSKQVKLLLLKKLYCESYDGTDFYEEFGKRLASVSRLLAVS